MHPVLIGPYEEVALTWTNTRHRTRKGSTNAQSVFSSTGFSRTIALLVASFLLQLGCSVQSVQAVAGSKENVHYWYLPTASDIREAREQQRFHKHDPKCVKITSNLAPCDSMQYKSMRMPNLLQQTTLIEVRNFLDSFGDTRFLTCDPFAKAFLCSLVTPICFKDKAALEIFPCKRVCEQVMNNCRSKMSMVGLGVAQTFNCSQFKDDSMCMDPRGDASANNSSSSSSPNSSNASNNHAHGSTPKKDKKRDPTTTITGEDNNQPAEVTPNYLWTMKAKSTVVYERDVNEMNRTDIENALCHRPTSSNSSIIVRARLKTMRPRNGKQKRRSVGGQEADGGRVIADHGYFMKLKSKALKVFYDREDILFTTDNITMSKLDGKYLWSYHFITMDTMYGKDKATTPRVKDVVYLFMVPQISTKGGVTSISHFTVQYIVPDNGKTQLRKLMNSAADKENPIICTQ